MGMHVGRAWGGHEIEDKCLCPQEDCGLVDINRFDKQCKYHDLTKTIRQLHDSDDCPGAESKNDNYQEDYQPTINDTLDELMSCATTYENKMSEEGFERAIRRVIQNDRDKQSTKKAGSENLNIPYRELFMVDKLNQWQRKVKAEALEEAADDLIILQSKFEISGREVSGYSEFKQMLENTEEWLRYRAAMIRDGVI